jgi:hypothetical protein
LDLANAGSFKFTDGTITVDGGTFTCPSNLVISGASVTDAPVLRLVSGSAGASSGLIQLGTGNGLAGAIEVSGGSLAAHEARVGNAGIGSVAHSAGTATLSGNLYVGYGSGSVGTYTLSNSATLTVSGYDYAGIIGHGVINQTGGRHQTTIVYLGTDVTNSTNAGTYNLSGGTLDVAQSLELRSRGVFNFSGGTLAVGTLSSSFIGTGFNWTGGTLRVNKGTATLGAGVTLTIPNTGTLGGVGNIQRPVTASSGGTLAPGNSVGTISTGALTLETGSTYFVEVDLDGNAADKTQVTGIVNLSGVDNGVGTVGGATLEFALLTGGTPPLPTPRTFILIDNDLADPIAGVFDGLTENTTYVRGGVQFSVDYHAGSGNDVGITFTEVPEPTGMLGLIGAGGMLLGRRRRAA